VRVRALHLAGRDGDARDELERAFVESGAAAPLWETAATLIAANALDPADLLEPLGRVDEVALFGWIAGAPVEGNDGIAEALWSMRAGSPVVLAAALLFAWRLDAGRALVWSARLAASGASNRSPVHERAERPGVEANERVRAAIMGAALDAARSRTLLTLLLPLVADEDLLDLFELCVEHAGPIIDGFIVAAATSATRCLLIANELVRRGHQAEALSVLVAGLSLPSADALTRDVFDRLVPQPQRRVLARTAADRGEAEVAAILASIGAGA
jgi:hypothetical protein